MSSILSRRTRSFAIVQCCLMVTPSIARRWVDIVHPEDMKIYDSQISYVTVEEDPFLSIETATEPPLPTFPTSSSPDAPRPSGPPITPQPTPNPANATSGTTKPTKALTNAPTPSQSLQSVAPTKDPYPENPVPDFPDPTYFNYDPSQSNLYGPGYPELEQYNATTLAVVYENNGWANVGIGDDFYWAEFDDPGWGPWQGVLSRREPATNRCDGVGKQSPIDVRPNGAICYEHHQIRIQPGDYKIKGAEIEKQIHPNKLRLKYQRRPCSDLLSPDCVEPDPPNADFPNNWGGSSDLMHVDFKVPSEHMILGQRYDAEMQLFHLHPSRRRNPTRSVVIQATPNGHNVYLQAALDAFEYVYNVHQAECSSKRRKERQLLTDVHELLGKKEDNPKPDATDYSTWADYSTEFDNPDFESNRVLHERFLQYWVWNPHHVELVPSYYFYGYEGSLTEPPCGEWVSWFVCDTPMIISTAQLELMKKLLFTHIDGECKATSVHFRQSVARPIQDTAGRPVWQCTQADFLPDRV